MATEVKYPVLNRENLTILMQIELSQKQITLCEFFAVFLKFRLNYEYFEKKYDPHRFCVSEITESKTWSHKCLKSSVSEDASTSNLVTLNKHCWNLHHSTFKIISCHWQGNCFRKSLSYWHDKSCDCLLTRIGLLTHGFCIFEVTESENVVR